MKKYLDIYEQIDARINGLDQENIIKTKREARSLERGRHNQGNKRYMSGQKINRGQGTTEKLSIHEQNKVRLNSSNQGISYYPASK